MIKIAFLFLTISGIQENLEPYWRSFFDGHKEKYALYVHAKNRVAPHSWFKQFELPFTLENSWARTMKCQIGMLKEALKDPDNQLFIFCSQNTLPLQDFNFIYNELTQLNKSVFYYEPNPHMNPEDKSSYAQHRVLKPIPESYQHKNSQWVILNRKHAQMMVQDEQIVRIITHYPHDQEHYPSTFLAMHNQLNEVHKKESTLVVWHLNKRPPYVFNDFNNNIEWQTIRDAITYGTYFVRKIGEQCDLKPLDKILNYRCS